MSSEIASIRPCADADFDAMYAVINAAATAYAGVIPADRYHVPYMPAEELRGEIAAGVRFWGWHDAEGLSGVMGIQHVDDVTLIRHAYVTPERQGTGIGSRLLGAPPEPAARASACRDLGRRDLGRALLRAPRLPPGQPRGEGPPAAALLEHPRAPGRHVRGAKPRRGLRFVPVDAHEAI